VSGSAALHTAVIRAFACVALLAGCHDTAPGDGGASPSPRPHIVLIMADDLGYETLGVNGGASYRTDALDALATSGVRFTHAYSTPLCSPSRVQIMTGRYNHRNYRHWGVLSKGEATFAHLLRGAGYATFAAGKWQLLGHPLRWASEPGCCRDRGQSPSEAGFGDYLLWFVGGRGARYADPLLWRPGPDGRPRRDVVAGAYGPDLFTDFLLEKIEQQLRERPEQPFFAYYSMVLPHAPFVPTPESPDWRTARQAAAPAHFAKMVSYMDHLVGRIVAGLERLEIRDDTVVIFTADNGTPREIVSRLVDGTTVRGGKGLPTRAGTHVPLIVSWPGPLRGGRTSDALVDFSDFLPTLADLAGAERPAASDGRSFLPVLRGEARSARDHVFTDYQPRYPGFPPARYVHDRRYKLYADGRLFDVSRDPLEHAPLGGELEPEIAAVRARLQDELAIMRTPAPPGR